MTKQEITRAKEVDLMGVVQQLEIPFVWSSNHLKIVCPFHNENTGSCAIYSDHYFCYGCQENGDQIEFIKKILNISFIDAVKLLNKTYGNS